MKIKNLAFFGIMAAIMGVAGTARADTTTVIASQAYVDAKDDLKQDNAKRIQTTKSAYDALEKSDDAKKEDYPSMYTLENSITAIGSDNFATKNLDNLTNTGKANVSAQGTYDSEATYVTGTVGKAIKDNAANIATNTTNIETINTTLQGKQDTLTFDNVPTANSNNPVKSGGVKTELDAKQGNLGGGDNAGKAVIATDTAGTVQYRTIAIDASTAGSTDLLTAGAINNAIGNASTAVNSAYSNNALTREGLEAASNLAKMAAVQDTIARQGSLTKAWNEEFDSTAATEGNATNLYNATTNATTNANATPDNYVPTVAAVEKRVTSAITEAVNTAQRTIGSATKSATENNMVTSVTTENGVVTAVGSAKVTNDYVASNAGIASTKLNVGTGYDSSTATGDVTTSDSVQTALAKIENKANNAGTNAINGLNVTDTENDKPVTAVNQTDGEIAVTHGTISYAEGLKYNLSNINTQGGNGSSACVQGSPCTLTMFMNNGTPVYEWTNMDTESTDAVL